MKNLVFAVVLAGVSSLWAADPNPYSSYGKAMASVKDQPMAVEFQDAHDAEIADATEPSVLAAFVADEESALALLAQLKGAYDTCPIVLTQIAAVTQWVMLPEPCAWWFWKPSPAAGRKVWVAALEAKMAASTDSYIKTFCQQQLDLCR